MFCLGESIASACGDWRTAGCGLFRGRHQTTHYGRQRSILHGRTGGRGGETEQVNYPGYFIFCRVDIDVVE